MSLRVLGLSRPVYQPSGRSPGHLLHDRDRLADVLALGRLVDVLVGDPAQAVARDLVPGRDACGRNLGIARERGRDAEDRQRQRTPLELAQDAPHAHARAVFVDAFHREMARGVRGGLNISDRNCSLPASPCRMLLSPPSS
jgi:hypothetical protein